MVTFPGAQLLSLAADEQKKRQLAALMLGQQQQGQQQQLMPLMAATQVFGDTTPTGAAALPLQGPQVPQVSVPTAPPPKAPPAPPPKMVLPSAGTMLGTGIADPYTTPWGKQASGETGAGAFVRSAGEMIPRATQAVGNAAADTATDAYRFFTETPEDAAARRVREASRAGKLQPAGVFGQPQQAQAQTGQQPQGPNYDTSPYSVVLGYGKLGSPQQVLGKPLENLNMGEAYGFGRNVLIPASQAKGIGTDSRGLVGSSAMGAYQITSENMQRYGQQLWGDKWRQQPYNAATQDAIGQKMFEANRNNLVGTWAGLGKLSPDQLAALKTMPWDQAKLVIQKMEGTAGGNAGRGGTSNVGELMGVDTYGNRALNTLQDAERRFETPFSVTSDEVPRPAVPELMSAPHRDFTAQDKALQDMKPEEFAYADQKRMLRSNLFAGMAQALANTPDGAGLGKVLGMFGAGIASGRAQGEDEVRKRQDFIDAKMAQWKGMVYRNEDEKGNVVQQELVNDTNTHNQNLLNKYNQATEEWKRNQPQVTEAGALTTKVENGKRITTWTPRPGVAAMQAGAGMANIMMQQDEFKAGVNQLELKIQLQQSMAAALQSGDPQAIAQMPSLYAGAAAQAGQTEKILNDPEAYQQLNDEATKAANDSGLPPMTKEWAEKKQEYEAAWMAQKAGGDPKFFERLQAFGTAPVQLSRAKGDEEIRQQTAAAETRSRLDQAATMRRQLLNPF